MKHTRVNAGEGPRQRPCAWRLALPALALVALPLGYVLPAYAQPPRDQLTEIKFPADGQISFERDVRPIFASACYDCHGPAKRKGQLRLDISAAALKGGNAGPIFTPGKPDESNLIDRILGRGDEQRMPLDRDPLPDACIKILTAWVEQGAIWPDDGLPIDHGQEERHWAYVPPVRMEPPSPAETLKKWPKNPIDNFVLDEMTRHQLAPTAEAERSQLLRRVTLDLTGLPPTVEEANAYLADTRPDAYERLVDRLLASPRYGERWARPWLDLARYADSHGYEKDGGRSVWPYRDWVIDALNADMPFDQFTIEQIAGDLLPNPTHSQLIATGFHRNSMINEEGGVDAEEYRVNAVIDRANTTATVWLGATLGCAQCHDHKFDPYSQKDYYRFFAFFNTTEEESRLVSGSEMQEISPKLDVSGSDVTERRDAIIRLESFVKAVGDDAPEAVRAKKDLEVLRNGQKPTVTTLVMREQKTARQSHILNRGSFMSPGDPVEPGVPAALGSLPETSHATRADLAHWLVSGSNPVTARVTVNRLWELHFGRGIVETSEDFGTRGTPPVQPRLLDWLATELIAQKWSLKAIHRLIVTSATYRQAPRVTPAALEADSNNHFLARGPRFRLEAEIVRDQALSIGGLISLKMGGPPVFPVQPPGIWASPYSANNWTTSEGEDLHRRAIYTYWRRSSPYPQFVSFDAPPRQVACTRRARTNTPLQALTTLNDPVFFEAAQGLAKRVLDRPESERLDFAMRACVCRSPTPQERDRLTALLQQQIENYRQHPGAAADVAGNANNTGMGKPELAAWTVVCNVLLNLDEVLTNGS